MIRAAVRTSLVVSVTAIAVSACATVPAEKAEVVADNPLGWLSGCWITEDGTFREVWAVDGDKHLFGHNTVRTEADPETIVFFEQMRLQDSEGTWTFSAYPNGVGPSDFPRTASGPALAEFTNAAHDFPQRITYQREGETLKAEISTLDGERQQAWTFIRCAD